LKSNGEWKEYYFDELLNWVANVANKFPDQKTTLKVVSFLQLLLEKCPLLDVQVRIKCQIVTLGQLFGHFSKQQLQNLLQECLENHYGNLVEVANLILQDILNCFDKTQRMEVYQQTKQFIESKNYVNTLLLQLKLVILIPKALVF
jgi:hypothetical protein